MSGRGLRGAIRAADPSMDEAIAATTDTREEVVPVTMTRKQLKAIRLSKLNRRKRNIRTNNMSVNPMREWANPFQHQNHMYRLYQI